MGEVVAGDGEELGLVNEPIDPPKPIEQVRKEPLTLVPGFTWDTLDIDDTSVLKELYKLLNENYVEDDDNMFRFDYSAQFLQWALKPPNWVQDWHCGVRATKNNLLVGFISAIPATVCIHEKPIEMVEINFLCVHKKLRSKRMAPVLIKEITRRVNLHGIFQAVYTAGVILPKPVGSCRYWHRSLNPKKLIEVEFSHLTRNMTLQRTIKLYKLPPEPKIPGFRELESKDLPKVAVLVNEYLSQFKLAPYFSVEEVQHWFMPRPEVIGSYVVERNKEIVAFTSFYTLPSTVMRHPTIKSIKAAYSYYNVPSEDVSIQDLITDALIMAKKAGHDVFNALDLMQNKKFLEELKFGKGDGNLQYYLHNWKCNPFTPEQIGLVLQ